MNAFSTIELERLQATQTGAMQDICIVQSYSTVALNDYGLPVPIYTPGSAIACGFKPTSDERQAEGQVAVIDAKLRLPIATIVTEHDRIQITKRYGVAITPQMYNVFGPPERGPSGLIVRLKTVTE